MQQKKKGRTHKRRKGTAKHRKIKRNTNRAFASKKKETKEESRWREAACDKGLYMRFYQFLSSLNFSLSLFLKTEFLFGKTNRAQFHEEFLTLFMKLGSMSLWLTNPICELLNKNSLKLCSNVFSIRIPDSTKSNTLMKSLTLPI